jgi:PAS domain S-box-containing protein
MLEQRTVDILESITDEFFALDHQWRYTYINERALDRIRGAKGEGLRRDDLLGKNTWELYPEFVGSRFYEELHRALREQKTVELEEYSPLSERWFEVRAFPPEEGLSVYARDVTERKEAEKERAYHAHLLENIHDAVIATDEGFVITTWNKGAERMFGWKAEEALGHEVYEVIPTNFGEEEMVQALRDLTEAGRWHGDMIMRLKEGTPVHVDALTVALRQEGGEITGYLNITRDITERKRAEEEIETRARQQAAVAELGQKVLASEDLDSLMDEAVACVGRTLGVEYAKIAELLPGWRGVAAALGGRLRGGARGTGEGGG